VRRRADTAPAPVEAATNCAARHTSSTADAGDEIGSAAKVHCGWTEARVGESPTSPTLKEVSPPIDDYVQNLGCDTDLGQSGGRGERLLAWPAVLYGARMLCWCLVVERKRVGELLSQSCKLTFEFREGFDHGRIELCART